MNVIKHSKPDPSMIKIKKLFQESGWTHREFGLRIGYPERHARQASFQFLSMTNPTIQMLRKVARVFKVQVEDLL